MTLLIPRAIVVPSEIKVDYRLPVKPIQVTTADLTAMVDTLSQPSLTGFSEIITSQHKQVQAY
jgi:hypothetical protein